MSACRWGIVVVGLCGCSTLATVEGGYQQPFEAEHAPGHRGAAIDVHFGMGATDAPVGAEASLRTKFGSHQGQWAIGAGGFAFTPPSAVGAFGRLGLNLVQLEAWSGELAFGMGSPWAQAGVYLLPEAFGADDPLDVVFRNGGFVITLSASTGYDVRFGDAAPNTGWWSVTAGVGILTFWGR